jgi:tetratricopeptide (TPR) repeat protein
MRKCLSLLIFLVAAVSARAQDTVRYLDRAAKKEVPQTGKITEETPAGVKVQLGKGKVIRDIATADIVQIYYKVNDIAVLDFNRPFNIERQALLKTKPKLRVEELLKAHKAFQELEAKVKTHAMAHRYIQFKAANVMASIARDDPTRVTDAIKALREFKSANAGGWEIVPALTTLGRLQEETGKADDARKTYEELAALPNVSKAIKQESDILVARLYLRGGKFADAEKRLAALGKTMSNEDVQKPFVTSYLAESQMGQGNLKQVEAKLKEAIRTSGDTRLRALANNLLGDYYRRKNQPEDALWSYLRVDALYNDDIEEHAKALYHLRTLFDKVKNDRARAKECETRLQTKHFAGTLAQKMAAGEKK